MAAEQFYKLDTIEVYKQFYTDSYIVKEKPSNKVCYLLFKVLFTSIFYSII